MVSRWLARTFCDPSRDPKTVNMETMAQNPRLMSAIRFASAKYNITYCLKDKQIECLDVLVRGKDLLAILPTGCGKTLVYALLPSCSSVARVEVLPIGFWVGRQNQSYRSNASESAIDAWLLVQISVILTIFNVPLADFPLYAWYCILYTWRQDTTEFKIAWSFFVPRW